MLSRTVNCVSSNFASSRITAAKRAGTEAFISPVVEGTLCSARLFSLGGSGELTSHSGHQHSVVEQAAADVVLGGGDLKV
jgi:hypothetical protein